MSAPVQPVTLTVRDLTRIRTALTEKAHALRAHADTGRGATGPERAGMREHAAGLEDLAARLSFAVPGDPVEVTE